MAYSWSDISRQIHRSERERVRGRPPDRQTLEDLPARLRTYYGVLGAFALSVLGAVIALIATYILTVWLLHLQFD